MQAQLECEHCGKTPDQTEFSTKMLHKFPPSGAKAVQFGFVHLYLHAATPGGETSLRTATGILDTEHGGGCVERTRQTCKTLALPSAQIL